MKTSVALKFRILQNLITTDHRKYGKSKYDLQTDRTQCRDHANRYRVNGVLRFICITENFPHRLDKNGSGST